MFAAAFFGSRYFGAAYFGKLGAESTGADPAAVWAYVLSNGKTAGQNLVEVNNWLQELRLLHGLVLASPLTVTPTSRTAGAVEQAVASVGEVVTVTRL